MVILLELRCDLYLLDKTGDHHCICRSASSDLKIIIIVSSSIITIIIVITIIVIILIPGQRRYREQLLVSPAKTPVHNDMERIMMKNMMVMMRIVTMMILLMSI